MAKHNYGGNLLQSSTSTKVIIYAITLISNCSFAGLIGSYSILKKDIQDELDLQTSFLGFMDSLSFLGRLFGFIYLIIWPSVKLKKDYLISCVLTTLFFLLLPFSTLFPSLCIFLLPISFFFSGFFRVYIIVPYIIVSQYFDPVYQHKSAISIWYSIQGMGDVFAIIFTAYLLQTLQLSWQSSLIANLLCYLTFSILLYAICRQVVMDEELISSERGTAEIIHLTDEEGHISRISLKRESRKTQIYSATQILKNFFKSDFGNCLWLLDYSLMSAFYYCILCWFPFYFMGLGLSSFVFYVVIMYSVFSPIGTIIFQVLNKKFKIPRRKISIFMMISSALIHIAICFTSETQQNLMIYISLVALDGIFQGGTFSSISSWELSYRTKGNRQKYLVMSGVRLFYQFVIFLSMLAIGLLMQISNKSFLYFMAALVSFDALLCFCRHKKYMLIEEHEQNGQIYMQMEQK